MSAIGVRAIERMVSVAAGYHQQARFRRWPSCCFQRYGTSGVTGWTFLGLLRVSLGVEMGDEPRWNPSGERMGRFHKGRLPKGMIDLHE